MNNINTEKKLRVIDAITCVVIAGIYIYATWALKRYTSPAFVIRIALVFWFVVILIRFSRLLQYVTTFNVDLTRYVGRDLESIEIPFKKKFKEWRPYLKEPLKKARLFYIVFFLIYVLHIFIKINDGVYFVTTGLLLFVYVTIVIYSIATKVEHDIATIYSKYKPDVAVRHRKQEIITHIKRGLIAAAAFDFCVIILFNFPIYQYVLLFIAFSLLYSFSAILIHLYRSFSEAIFIVLGHKFDQLQLISGYPYD